MSEVRRAGRLQRMRLALLAGAALALAAVMDGAERPSIVIVLADDLARGDLGCYGQRLIRTPNLDRLASQGMRCTQAYSGTSVCAPSRASLMTGLDMGHCPIRANRELEGQEGQMPLPAGIATIAGVARAAGYATACIGKWGMGRMDSDGSPLRTGFDRFYGFACQRQAHTYFPSYLYDDANRVEIPGRTYVQDLFQREALAWVRRNHERPFLLYYALTLPHAKLEIDDLGEYADRPWTPRQKAYAAMVARLDRDVGQLDALLHELGIARNTLMIIAGDNGSAFATDSEIGAHFAQAQGLRGCKRSMYEGGLRQAGIITWPAVVAPGRVEDQPWAFWDILPTVAEVAGTRPPEGGRSDGVSLLPMLRGGRLPPRESLYWELHEGGFQQAVRFGDWKAVRRKAGGALELYDLAADPGESGDVAGSSPQQVARAESLMAAARVDDPAWPVR